VQAWLDAVGEGITPNRVGERVWIWNGQWARPLGTASEYMAVPSAQAVVLPEGTDFAAGACLGIPALTAIQAVHLAGDLKDKTVLVTGGVVGGWALHHPVGHLGRWPCDRHGRLTGEGRARPCCRHEGRDLLQTESVAERVKALTGGQGVSVIIDMDFASTAQWVAAGALAAHGTVVCYGSNAAEVTVNFRAMLFGSITVKFSWCMT